MTTIFTVGHSNHTQETFLALLRLHKITAIADVRSSPYSRFAPQLNKEELSAMLSKNDIAYVFLGKNLGARPRDPACYSNGSIDFAKLAKTEYFKEGIDRVCVGAAKYNLALMCTEKDPIQCHRTILVCRHLRAHDHIIKHILEDGELEDNRDSENRLVEFLRMDMTDLFKSQAAIIEEAYDKQGTRIAFHEDVDKESEISSE